MRRVIEAWWLSLMRWLCVVYGHDHYTMWTTVLDRRGSFSHRAFVRMCARCDFAGECPPHVSVTVGRER